MGLSGGEGREMGGGGWGLTCGLDSFGDAG